jgi:hypothetical protein
MIENFLSRLGNQWLDQFASHNGPLFAWAVADVAHKNANLVIPDDLEINKGSKHGARVIKSIYLIEIVGNPFLGLKYGHCRRLLHALYLVRLQVNAEFYEMQDDGADDYETL